MRPRSLRSLAWPLAALALPLAGVATSRAADRPTVREEVLPTNGQRYTHSRDDEVVPLRPTADIVRVLRDKGVEVELVVVEGLTHYQVPAFVPYMRAAIPWIKRAWKK